MQRHCLELSRQLVSALSAPFAEEVILDVAVGEERDVFCAIGYLAAQAGREGVCFRTALAWNGWAAVAVPHKPRAQSQIQWSFALDGFSALLFQRWSGAGVLLHSANSLAICSLVREVVVAAFFSFASHCVQTLMAL